MMARALLLLSVVGIASADVTIATFDGAKATTLTWKEQDDPVMGGKSKGSFTIDKEAQVGIFNGTCAIVPSLQAPGFIKVVSLGSIPDVSGCKNLVLNMNSKAAYKGFRISFGLGHYPGGKRFAYGYKSNFEAPVGEFGDVVLPFTGFSDHWDDGSGEPITKCVDDKKACPTTASLQKMRTINIWAEGVEGDINLKVKSIRASDCSSDVVQI